MADDIFVSNDIELDADFGEVFIIDQGVVTKVIANKYNPTQTYDVGDYVINVDKLYKCITAVVEPEEFDNTKWENVKLANEVQSLNEIVPTKADKADTYTKTETNTLLNNKADKSNTYTKSEVDTALANKVDTDTLDNYYTKDNVYTKTEVNDNLALKADKADTYTKGDVNDYLALKADKSDTYTKSETDTALNAKADSDSVYNKSETYSKVEVDNKINNLPAPMIFKGTLGTGGTITTLPTASSENEGYTYKVITDGTYASIPAKVGDMFTSNGTAWVHIPSGDETFTDTWRGIKVNGIEQLTSSIGSGDVDFINGTNSTVVFDASGNKIKVNVDGYTQSQIDSKLQEKANASDVYNKTETYTKTEVDNIASTKADKSDTYTKEEVDDKVDVSDTVSGAVASFDDGSGLPFQEIKCTINAIQEGTPWIDSNVIEKEPYNFRKVAGTASRIGNHLFDKLVGGTVAWNQLQTSKVGSSRTAQYAPMFGNNWDYTVTIGHVYFVSFLQPAGCSVYRQDCKNFPCGYRTYDTPTTATTVSFITKSTENAVSAGVGERLISKNKTTETAYSLDNLQFIDLTAMFGSKIADYIYSLEQATAGAGVAWFKKLFPNDYYAYNAGELISVKTTAHKMVGKNLLKNEQAQRTEYSVMIGQSNLGTYETYLEGGENYHLQFEAIGTSVVAYYKYENGDQFNISSNGNFTPIRSGYVQMWLYSANLDISSVRNFMLEFGSQATAYEPYTEHNYALDNVELRGLFKLDSNNKLYADGDTYESSGDVGRKYVELELGNMSWSLRNNNETRQAWYTNDTDGAIKHASSQSEAYKAIMSNGFKAISYNDSWVPLTFSPSESSLSQLVVCVAPSQFVDGTAFANWLSTNNVKIVIEAASETTETADPFTNPQQVDANGTEEYVDNRSVAIPVGHETYYADIYDISGFTSCKVSVKDGSNVERKSATILFGQTVYDGYLEYKNGAWEFTGIHRAIELDDNSISWSWVTNWYQTTDIPNIKYVSVNTEIADGKAERYIIRKAQGMSEAVDGELAVDTSNVKVCTAGNGTYPSGKFVYPLETPFTLTLTGAQLETLLGENRVSHDCNGDTEVKYIRQTDLLDSIEFVHTQLSPVLLSATLTAGSSSITISDSHIKADSLLDIWTDPTTYYTDITVTNGSVTINTFPTMPTDTLVKVRVN